MTKYLVGAVSVFLLVGCGETSSGTDGSVIVPDSGTVMVTDSGTVIHDAGTTVVDAGHFVVDAGTGNTGTADAGTTCVGYCTAIMANCTATHAQYPTMESCMGSCLGFPQGTYGATSGNNLECRGYHAVAAGGDATTHCPHAGPTGDGVCGDKCESYCAIDLAACTGGNAAFASASACTAACANFAALADRYNNDSVVSGDSFACRTYHLTVAATAGGAQAMTHCPHTEATSVACHN